MVATDAGALRLLVQPEVESLLTEPEVVSAGVWFAVEGGQLVGEPTLQVGVRPGAGSPHAWHVPVPGPVSRPLPPALVGGGFDPQFLKHPVPLPTLTKAVADDALPVPGGTVLDYTHFSLTMSRSRRFARWVAWNVDGAALRKLSRSGMTFRPDPRIPAEAQVGDDLYAGNRLDRGHLARRADLTWGEPVEAATANSDSFFFTNITPQMDDFNQSRREGLWGRLEDAVYEQVDVQGLRISVLGGPIFHEDDPVYRGVALPVEFWKIVVYVEQDELKARAFLLTQNVDHREILNLDEFRVYQVGVAALAERTGIDFGSELIAAGGPQAESLTAARPLTTLDDIRW